ncbi:MAG: 4-hydroxy-3-methylbut-2-enyl diphosphate reductase [Pleomorphochaeta sp.]
MEVIKSDVIGYCSGVSRAISIMKEAVKVGDILHKKVYSLGHIIHNPQVVERIKEYGVSVIEEADADKVNPGIVVLRAHGVSDKVRRLFLNKGFYIFDATCPIVLKEQDMVLNAQEDETIVIIGGKTHPEAVALKSVETPTKKIIISDVKDIIEIPTTNNLFVVIQSTFPSGRSRDIENSLETFAKENKIKYKFANELCNSNQRRRDAVAELSKKCNCIIVIGGKNSSNTRGLYNYCKNSGVESYLISNKDEIPSHLFDYDTVGLATGTSTPLFVIEEIEEKLKRGKNET